MAFVDNERRIFEMQYDPNNGRFSRVVKPLNIFNIAGAASTNVSTVLASGSVAGNREILITSVGYSSAMSSGTTVTFDVVVNTSTILTQSFVGISSLTLVTSQDAPFARVNGTTMVTAGIRAPSAGGGSVSAWVNGVVFPKIEALESK